MSTTPLKTDPLKDSELHDKINRETARLPWSELAQHHAAGSVIWIDASLDLVEVALRIAHDDKPSIEAWLRDGKLGRVTEVQARTWEAADSRLWASVVSPFVLVQPEKTSFH